MSRSSARIRTSEPAFKPHLSQSQRDRMTGVIQPMDAPCSRSPWSALRRISLRDVVAVTLFATAFVAMVLA